MIKERAMELVAELRSGKHKQTRSYLHTEDDSKCCLGVACSMVPNLHRQLIEGAYCYGKNRNRGTLPREAMDYFGFFGVGGETRNYNGIWIEGMNYFSLANANDGGVGFDKIADYIEANYELL